MKSVHLLSTFKSAIEYWVSTVLFITLCITIAYFDLHALLDIRDFYGGTNVISNIGFGGILILAVLIIVKVFNDLLALWNLFLAFKWLEYFLVFLYIMVSLVVLGMSHAFMSHIEESSNTTARKTNEYYLNFVKFSDELLKEAVRYKGDYENYLKKLMSFECSPYAGGEGYYCKQYKGIFERGDIDKEWSVFKSKTETVLSIVKKKKENLDNIKISISLKEASATVDNINKASKELIDSIDESVGSLVFIAGEVEKKFSAKDVDIRKGIDKLTELPAQAKPVWPSFEFMSELKKKDLHIERMSSVSGILWKSFISVIKQPLIIVLLVIYFLFWVAVFRSNYRYYSFFIANNVNQIIDGMKGSIIRAMRDINSDDWEKYLYSGKNSRCILKRILKPVVFYYSKDNDGIKFFESLYYLCEHLKTIDIKDKKIKNILTNFNVVSVDNIEILEGLRAVFTSTRFFDIAYPSLKKYSIIDLEKIIKKSFKNKKSEKIELDITESEFRNILKGFAESDDDFVEINLRASVRERVMDGLNLIRDILCLEIKEIKNIPLLSLEDNVLKINYKFLRLLKYNSLFKYIFTFAESRDEPLDLIRSIEDSLTEMQNLGYDLDKLLELESKLDSVKNVDNLRHDLKVWIYKEIARQYTHRANSVKALEYLQKIEDYTKEIDPKILSSENIEEYLVEAKLVYAHMLADSLNYSEALQIIDDLIEKIRYKENSSLYISCSAKGHILAVSGRAEEAVLLLKKAYNNLRLSERMQSGITLIRALINTKESENRQLIERYINEIEGYLANYYKDITESNSNRRFLLFEKTRYYYLLYMSYKRYKRNSGDKIANLINLWSGIDDAKPIMFTNKGNDKNLEKYYPEILSMHMKIIVDFLNGRSSDYSAVFYKNLLTYIKNNISKIHIVCILYLLCVAEWIYISKLTKTDFNEAKELGKKIKTINFDKSESKDEKYLLRKYAGDISTFVSDIISNPLADSHRDTLIKLKSDAEYIPAVLPKV